MPIDASDSPDLQDGAYSALRLRAMADVMICPDRLDDAALDRPIAVRWLVSDDEVPKPITA